MYITKHFINVEITSVTCQIDLCVNAIFAKIPDEQKADDFDLCKKIITELSHKFGCTDFLTFMWRCHDVTKL